MTINGTDFLAPELAALLANTSRNARPRHRVFPGDPGQVAHARRFVHRALAVHGPAEDAALLTSELATNAIQHTASGEGGTFEVIICKYPRTVRIAVVDAGSPSVPTLVPPGRLNASGRGLALVEALARQWGHQGNQRGRAVWFELDFPSPGAAKAPPTPATPGDRQTLPVITPSGLRSTADRPAQPRPAQPPDPHPRHPAGEPAMTDPSPAAPARLTQYNTHDMRAIEAGLTTSGLTTHLTDARAGLDLTATLRPSTRHDAEFWIDEDGYAELRYWNPPGTPPAQVTATAIRALVARRSA
jgi:serine/threonine-protein kinase RsbW